MSYEVLLLPLNRPTVNGRIYTREAIAGALESLKERVAAGDVLGEFGSPRERVACDVHEVERVDPKKQCLRVIELDLREDGLYGKIVAEGPFGGEMAKLIEGDRDRIPTMSMRSLNRLSPATPYVEETVRIVTFDFEEQSAYAQHEANATPMSPAGGIAPHMDALCYALVNDPEYAWSWFCNLKMPYTDAGADWASASKGAATFLSILTGGELDITKHPYWAKNVEGDASRDVDLKDGFPEIPTDRNVMSVTVEAPAHHGGQMVATALAQFLRKVLPSTEVISRRGAWDPVTLLAHEAAVRMAVDEGKLEIDDWNKDLTNEREFGVVVQVRPNRELRFDRRAPKD